MANKKRKSKKNKNKTDRFILFMTIACIILLIVWVVKDNYHPKDREVTPVIEESYYESFDKITVANANKMIMEDELTFIYFGYQGCNACDIFAPILKTVTDEYDMKVKFINTKEIDRKSKEWKKLTDKMTKKQKISTKNDDTVKNENKTIGDFLYENGYTPTVVIFKNNKLVDGHVGGLNSVDLIKMIESAGFNQK